MTTARFLAAILVAVALQGAAKPSAPPKGMPGAQQLGLSLQDQAEIKLTQGDYLTTLKGAYWASAMGPQLVPVLGKLLLHEQDYLKLEKEHTAFPFNTIWALGRIATPQAVATLKKYQAGKHSFDASFAIKAAALRLKLKDKEVGVSLREDVELYQAADHSSKVLKTLKRGTPVKALKYLVINAKQEGPRGGNAHFDQVKLWPNGPTGYLERAGDDFSTIY